MTPEENAWLRDFFNSVADRPLEPDDPKYICLYDDAELADHDPVEMLARPIEWISGDTVQLLSGFRGTGKSTELRRLRKRLQDDGYLVLLVDVEDYLNVSMQIDVSNFLMFLAGAIGEKVAEAGWLPEIGRESYWERLKRFLESITVEGVSAKLGLPYASVDIKANLKRDPTFISRVQELMAGRLGQLVEDVHGYISSTAAALREANPSMSGLVVLVDSVEHIRGTSVNVEAVQSSVETLFVSHASKLRLPLCHVVYTVPPWLKVLSPNLGILYEPGGIQMLPALKVADKGSGDAFQPGLNALERVVRARGDWTRLLGDRPLLDRLSQASGGHLRDLLYMLGEVTRRAETLPVKPAVIDRVISQVSSEFLPIPDEDARWLCKVAQTHRAALESVEKLPDLARFLDTHLVLCYWNGHEWYDIHPLVRDEVHKQVEARNE